MKRFSFSAALFGLSFFALTAQGQQTIQYPYNPDVDNDEYIATTDLTGFLAQFGQDFQPAPVLIDSVDLLTVIQMMQAQITALQSQVASLEASAVPGLGDYVSVDDSAHTVLVSGANLQVHNGQSTNASNGLGNVILGFNGLQAEQDPQETRNGSHNLVVGYGHFYTGNDNLISGTTNRAYGSQGVVFGFNNRSWDSNNTVLGGGNNGAYGNATTVVGGGGNNTYGSYDVVLGGGGNVTDGTYDVIVGGNNNATNGEFLVCLGGLSNQAYGSDNVMLGGEDNVANASSARNVVLGGFSNTTDLTFNSAVLGGNNNTIGGSDYESNSSVIVGGRYNNITQGNAQLIAGGLLNSIYPGGGSVENDFGRYRSILGGRGLSSHGSETSVMVGGYNEAMFPIDSVDSRGHVNLPAGTFLGGVQPENGSNIQVTGSTPD
jgi:hypothetical protein